MSPATTAGIPTHTVLSLLEAAYAAGATSRLAGPLLPREPRIHAAAALSRCGVGLAEIQNLCAAQVAL